MNIIQKTHKINGAEKLLFESQTTAQKILDDDGKNESVAVSNQGHAVVFDDCGNIVHHIIRK